MQALTRRRFLEGGAAGVAAVGLGISSLTGQDWARKAVDKSPRRREWVTVKHGSRAVESVIAYPQSQEKAPAILLAWYPGQQGGNAVADVLFGDVSPAGRLPVTFYRSADQLPPFADYAMDGRTYRYFGGDVLYPFGHGLSYTRFEYSDLRLSRARLGSDETVEVTLDVRNAGGREGDEVVQLYAREAVPGPGAPLRELRGFERVHLKAGEAKTLRFALVPRRDLARYDEAQKAFVVRPGDYEIELGASSRDLRLRARVTVQ
jgi:beta-glucosidase